MLQPFDWAKKNWKQQYIVFLSLFEVGMAAYKGQTMRYRCIAQSLRYL